MQKWHWQKCNNSITAQKVLGCVIFYFYVIPFNNAIAAVCPIEVHDSQPMFWNYWGLHEPLDCPGSNIKECHNSFSLWHCTELNSTTCSNFWEKAIKGRVTWKDKRTELLEQKLTRKWAGLFTTVFPPPSWLTAQIVFWSSDLYFILISYLSPELYYILITSSLGSLVYFFISYSWLLTDFSWFPAGHGCCWMTSVSQMAALYWLSLLSVISEAGAGTFLLSLMEKKRKFPRWRRGPACPLENNRNNTEGQS